ncbi:MAG: DsbA family oxidoreductase [Myxococcales bacterium]|nr:MAG: DsbA family oxidoreductase [Myxococcales bacterium]
MTTAPTNIRIDIVSDVVCPWCIIGFKQLQRALAELDGEVEVDLHWHPFELNPQMPPEGQDVREHLAQKYGTTVAKSYAARGRLAELGESVGFSFRYYDGMRIHNTFRAHQLLHFADEQGKQTELELALFESYFSREENVDDADVLVAAAGRAGLDQEQARAALNDGRYADTVRNQQRFWLSKGIQAVPSFVLDQRYLIPGAQDSEVFVAALKRLRDEKAA